MQTVEKIIIFSSNHMQMTERFGKTLPGQHKIHPLFIAEDKTNLYLQEESIRGCISYSSYLSQKNQVSHILSGLKQ